MKKLSLFYDCPCTLSITVIYVNVVDVYELSMFEDFVN